MECLDKIQHRQADFVPVDPEDMYVAAKIPQQDFIIFKEIRTKEEPDGKFLITSLNSRVTFQTDDTYYCINITFFKHIQSLQATAVVDG